MVLRLTLILLLIMTINVATAKEVQCLADMAYIEARGEGSRGIKAVNDVMFNRIKSPKFPSTVCSNYYKRGQYERAGAINKTPGVRQTEAYKRVLNQVSSEYKSFINGTHKDSVNGALFFNATGNNPIRDVSYRMRLGSHHFYR